jgi:CHAT domain-containing protein
VSYAPSLSSLKEIIGRARGRSSKRKKDFLAFGDPIYGDSSANSASYPNPTLPRLPFSEKEVDKISKSFRPQERTIFKRKEATELTLKNVRPDDFRIIHFAAHGLIDDRNPVRSSIVLSLDPDSPEDGFLQAREIFDLRLNADLIVLSSCRSAGGRLVRGEGIEGLNRSFFYAGASAVLMSLWAVNDEATSLLMERFYLYLKTGDSIAGALQKAKMDLIGASDFSHPYYWAGFIVSGNAAARVFAFHPLSRVASYWPVLIIGIVLWIVMKHPGKRKQEGNRPCSRNSRQKPGK